jgi:hypothetical protein
VPEQTCGLSSKDGIYIDKLYFSNFTYLSVTKSTKAYNNTYFGYGALLGLGYPGVNYNTNFSDYIVTELTKRGDIS